jgi:hypothetical protein
MRKNPPLRFVREDPLLIATNRLIMTIGSSRYALDISTRCTELEPSPAEVIPIDGHFKKGQRKTDVVTEPHQQRGLKASIISPPRGTETIF